MPSDDASGSALTWHHAFGVQYQRLREGAHLPRIETRTRSKRKNTLVPEEAKKLAEEEARRKAQTFVPDDKWEEANTTVWFPVAPNKRLWDYQMLFALVYSVVAEPFRMAFNAPAAGYI